VKAPIGPSTYGSSLARGMTVKHLMVATFVAVLLLLTGCNSEGVVAGTQRVILVSDCEPDSTVADPLIGPEALARSQGELEAWALFFNTFPMRPTANPSQSRSTSRSRLSGQSPVQATSGSRRSDPRE
jgi:hypothetical protein